MASLPKKGFHEWFQNRILARLLLLATTASLSFFALTFSFASDRKSVV
jgi:hypothetical protein